MSLVPFPSGGDDNRSSTNSAKTPPLSRDSLAINSPSSPIPRDPVKLTARSCLYELCAKSRWKRPVFTCCNENGPTNLRSFTYKAVVEMKEEDSKSWILVECIGKPQFNKKNAADSAAEGVLWYLVHLGYPKKA
ncbi:unnamed protein product [Lactuca saligna]|uniref:DRBM domain-containing protein n=1 Tax=Lactuca saligna TaxID=75948 RepID=A0AA35V4M7_LACSI|nr:unnamed protein product [Lactuca saligna]